MSLGYSRFTVGLLMPDAATSALALVRSCLSPAEAGSEPRNIDGTMPAACTAPEPASDTRPL